MLPFVPMPLGVGQKRARDEPTIVRVAVFDAESTTAIPPSRDLTRMRISVATTCMLDGEDDVLNYRQGMDFRSKTMTTVDVGLGESIFKIVDELERADVVVAYSVDFDLQLVQNELARVVGAAEAEARVQKLRARSFDPMLWIQVQEDACVLGVSRPGQVGRYGSFLGSSEQSGDGQREPKRSTHDFGIVRIDADPRPAHVLARSQFEIGVVGSGRYTITMPNEHCAHGVVQIDDSYYDARRRQVFCGCERGMSLFSRRPGAGVPCGCKRPDWAPGPLPAPFGVVATGVDDFDYQIIGKRRRDGVIVGVALCPKRPNVSLLELCQSNADFSFYDFLGRQWNSTQTATQIPSAFENAFFIAIDASGAQSTREAARRAREALARDMTMAGVCVPEDERVSAI